MGYDVQKHVFESFLNIFQKYLYSILKYFLSQVPEKILKKKLNIYIRRCTHNNFKQILL